VHAVGAGATASCALRVTRGTANSFAHAAKTGRAQRMPSGRANCVHADCATATSVPQPSGQLETTSALPLHSIYTPDYLQHEAWRVEDLLGPGS